MTGRPLTERQLAVLQALAASAEPMTPNAIGYALGFQAGEITCGSANRGRGATHRSMGPAQRVIFSLNSLRKRGLVGFARRRDERSGMAYAITDAGRKAIT